MSTYNAMVEETQGKIDEIQWRDDTDYSLIQADNGIVIPRAGAQEVVDGHYFIDSVEEAESLIRAIQKAIELKWVS